jgi:hypothetical protein
MKKSNWSKTVNMIQTIVETTAAKAIYIQFATNTALVELKITEGDNIDRVVSEDDWSGDDEVGSGLIVLFFLFCLLKWNNLTPYPYSLTHSTSYQLLL